MVRSAMTTEEKEEIWRRYRAGASLRSIHQALGRSSKAVWDFVASTGGIPPVERSRSPLRLSLVEREEISRGLVTNESCRAIARRLGRAPSTVSREVGGHGGRVRYRAAEADRAAWRGTATEASEARRAPRAGRARGR
jgi:IS30 family transposase